MHGQIHVDESTLVSTQLTIGVHVPFAQKEDELLLGKIGVDERERDAMKRQIPCGVPRILPFVRHGNNVVVVKMSPILVAAVPALVRRLGAGGIAFKPNAPALMIKLF